MVEDFKKCTIQSTINNSGYYESDKKVDKIIDFEEHVDAISWLRNDSAEQIDAISDYDKLVVDGSNPKSDPRSDPKVGIYTTNGNYSDRLLMNS